MSIIGIDTLVYGVEDVATSARFFDDFGLKRNPSAADHVQYKLPEGSSVVIRHRDDAALPPSALVGDGVREVIWVWKKLCNMDHKDTLREYH